MREKFSLEKLSAKNLPGSLTRRALGAVACFFALFAQLHSAEAVTEQKEHFFPLMKSLVKGRPALPPPYGVSAIYSSIGTDWKFLSAYVGTDDPNIPAEFAANSDANIESLTAGIKLDVWILPFFNLFITGGKADADVQLLFKGAPIHFVPPAIGRPAEIVRGDAVVDFSLEGKYITVGGVLAGGYKNFFGSVDFSVTEIDFGKKGAVQGDQDHTYSIAPRIGYVLGLTQVWVGGRYFDYSSSYQGSVPLSGGGNFSFQVNLETASWNPTGGMRTVINKHWEALIEVGFGARKMVISSIGYRW